MAFDATARNSIATADKLTKSLQVPVVHRRWIGQDDTGKSIFAASVSPMAIVEKKQRTIRLSSTEETVSAAELTFLAPLTPYTPTVAGRQDPIDDRDMFTLPDGTTGPILRQAGGLFDPKTSRTYMAQVWLG